MLNDLPKVTQLVNSKVRLELRLNQEVHWLQNTYVPEQKGCWCCRQLGCVSKLTRTWVTCNIGHQAKDREKGSKGSNQVDILWYMFAKDLVIITATPSRNNYN